MTDKNNAAERIVGLKIDEWQQYQHLITKRKAAKLTKTEHETLISFSNRIEEANAKRIEKLLEKSQQTGELLTRLVSEANAIIPYNQAPKQKKPLSSQEQGLET